MLKAERRQHYTRRSQLSLPDSFWIHRGHNTVVRRYEFYFLVAKTIFYSLAALVRKILFCHSKIKFISLRHRVKSSIYIQNVTCCPRNKTNFSCQFPCKPYNHDIKTWMNLVFFFLQPFWVTSQILHRHFPKDSQCKIICIEHFLIFFPFLLYM